METDVQLKEAQKRLSDAIAAEELGNYDSGKLLLEYINDRVSSLISKMVAVTPLTDREYLECHGAVRELQSINTMLQFKSAQVAQAQGEVNAIQGK